MFQFPAFPTISCRQKMNSGRFPDLGYLRINARLAAPRSFSQLCHALRRLWTPRHPPCTLRSLTTLFLSAWCSTFFTTTPCSQRSWQAQRACQCSVFFQEWPGWWRRPDSNRRPPGCKPGALPTELRPRGCITAHHVRPGTEVFCIGACREHGSHHGWWACVDLNHGPLAYQANALTS